MPAVPPYIPPKDAAFGNWLDNFSSLISLSPPAYGLTPTDAVNIAGVTSLWDAAYALITSPSTKTAMSVQAKNVAKVNALALVRPYAQTISLNPGVSAANKIALGLNPKTSTPSPITPPASNPVLTLLSQAPGVVNFRYRDSAASPSVKSKPYGVKSCQLFGLQSATVVTDPTKLNQVATMAKSPYQFAFPAGYTPGSTWYFACRWQTQKGGVSPWSLVSALIAT